MLQKRACRESKKSSFLITHIEGCSTMAGNDKLANYHFLKLIIQALFWAKSVKSVVPVTAI